MKPFDILPHRYPFLFADRILEIEEGKRIVCLRNVTVDEEYLAAHFKDNPTFPFSLIIESMAQTSGFLLRSDTGNLPKIAFLAAIRDAKFMRPVTPGDQMEISSTLAKGLPPLYIFDALVKVNGEEVAGAEIILSDEYMK